MGGAGVSTYQVSGAALNWESVTPLLRRPTVSAKMAEARAIRLY